MKLIMGLESKRNANGKMIRQGRFECPVCETIIEKALRDGIRDKTCSVPCSYPRRQSTHGDASRGRTTRLYKVWISMRERCRSKKNKSFKHYGARGITVCPEWDDYLVFKIWALARGYTDNLTIDRINNDGNYEPSNCQFITKGENTRKEKTKFTIGEVEEIRKIYSIGKYSQKRMAKAYGVCEETIGRIIRNLAYIEETA